MIKAGGLRVKSLSLSSCMYPDVVLVAAVTMVNYHCSRLDRHPIIGMGSVGKCRQACRHEDRRHEIAEGGRHLSDLVEKVTLGSCQGLSATGI